MLGGVPAGATPVVLLRRLAREDSRTFVKLRQFWRIKNLTTARFGAGRWQRFLPPYRLSVSVSATWRYLHHRIAIARLSREDRAPCVMLNVGVDDAT